MSLSPACSPSAASMLAAIRQTVISCVVPPMVTILDSFCRKYLGHAPQWVDARSYTRMPILINNPSELGADRIVNSVAAYHKYGRKASSSSISARPPRLMWFQKRENI
jgi:pantothenate kinase type III